MGGHNFAGGAIIFAVSAVFVDTKCAPEVSYSKLMAFLPLQAPIEIPSIAQLPTDASGAGGGARCRDEENEKGTFMSGINPVGNGWNIQSSDQQPIVKCSS